MKQQEGNYISVVNRQNNVLAQNYKQGNAHLYIYSGRKDYRDINYYSIKVMHL